MKKFYDSGGARLITNGTDHPSWGRLLSGFGTHRELQTFVQAGIPLAAALKMATINPARAMRMGDSLGTIETSKIADLSIVRGNPLQDIRNTRNVQRVMLAGKVHDAAQLLASVKGKMGPATAADDEWWQGNEEVSTCRTRRRWGGRSEALMQQKMDAPVIESAGQVELVEPIGADSDAGELTSGRNASSPCHSVTRRPPPRAR